MTVTSLSLTCESERWIAAASGSVPFQTRSRFAFVWQLYEFLPPFRTFAHYAPTLPLLHYQLTHAAPSPPHTRQYCSLAVICSIPRVSPPSSPPLSSAAKSPLPPTHSSLQVVPLSLRAMSRLDYGLSSRFKPRKKTDGKFVLSDEQRQEMKEAFDLFDTEKTGRIDYHQLKVSMKAMGFEVRKADVLKLMKEYDRSAEQRNDACSLLLSLVI